MVPAKEILTKIEMREQVDYNGVIIVGDLDLSGLDLRARHVERIEDEIEDSLTEGPKLIVSLISIEDSEIRGEVNLSNVEFQKRASFSKTNFTKNANFGGATFGGDAYFGEAVFSGDDVYFGEAVFNSGVSFLGTKFSSGDADFGRAVFSGGDADFWGALFSGGDAYFGEAVFSGGDAYFGEAVFSGGDAYFGQAKFSGGDADFGYAQFSGGDAYFEGAEFSGGKADFKLAKFSSDANFITATFGGTVNFKLAKFNKSLIIEWQDIKDRLEYDPILYPILIKNYTNLSWFEDADDCYYQYKKIRRSSKPRIVKILDRMAQISHGYWVKPMYPLIWSIFFILVFGGVFSIIYGDDITKYSTEDIYKNSNTNNSTMLVKTGETGLKEIHILIRDYFLFSMETFTSGLTSFLDPSTEYKANGACKNLALWESRLGTLLIAIFFYAYMRIIRRK